MRMPPRAACALLASVLLPACSPGASAPPAALAPVAQAPSPQTSPPSPPAPPAAEPVAPAAPPAPEDPGPVAALVREAAAVEPGGRATALASGGETLVDPAVTFRVELRTASPDARLVLLDGRDALVPASGAQEVGGSTRLTLSPAAPLAPGARYTLRIEGAVSRELHDGDGKAYTPLALSMRTSGQPAPPEPKEKAKPKAKAKRRR
jgi:hypothetical protein